MKRQISTTGRHVSAHLTARLLRRQHSEARERRSVQACHLTKLIFVWIRRILPLTRQPEKQRRHSCVWPYRRYRSFLVLSAKLTSSGRVMLHTRTIVFTGATSITSLSPSPREGWGVSIAMSMSVCLSAGSHISETTRWNFTKFLCACCLLSRLGPAPTAYLRYCIYFRFCRWRRILALWCVECIPKRRERNSRNYCIDFHQILFNDKDQRVHRFVGCASERRLLSAITLLLQIYVFASHHLLNDRATLHAACACSDFTVSICCGFVARLVRQQTNPQQIDSTEFEQCGTKREHTRPVGMCLSFNLVNVLYPNHRVFWSPLPVSA